MRPVEGPADLPPGGFQPDPAEQLPEQQCRRCRAPLQDLLDARNALRDLSQGRRPKNGVTAPGEPRKLFPELVRAPLGLLQGQAQLAAAPTFPDEVDEV